MFNDSWQGILTGGYAIVEPLAGFVAFGLGVYVVSQIVGWVKAVFLRRSVGDGVVDTVDYSNLSHGD